MAVWRNLSIPKNVFKNSEGFAPPAFEGTVGVLHNTIAYTDTSAKDLFTLPVGAKIIAWEVNVSEAFNDGVSDLLDLGVTGTLERFAADLDVGAIDTQITSGFVGAEMFTRLTAETTVTGIYTPGTSASEGLADVCCFYILTGA